MINHRKVLKCVSNCNGVHVTEVGREYKYQSTVESPYLKLGYLKFCETRSVFMNQKYILIAFSNHNLASDTFLQVQITRSAN